MKKPPFLAGLLLLLGLGILCSLGVWQVKRLTWKQGILAQVAVQQALDPYEQALGFDDFQEKQAYRRGVIQGRFDHDYEITLGPRTFDKQVGYHLYTPLILETGQAVMVNRGWIDQAIKEKGLRPETMTGGFVAVAGMIVPMPQVNMFTPENDPEAGEWYFLDTALLVADLGAEVAPMVFWAEDSPYTGTQIVRASHYTNIPNNHLQYAIFWFAMAGVLLGVFYFRFLRG